MGPSSWYSHFRPTNCQLKPGQSLEAYFLWFGRFVTQFWRFTWCELVSPLINYDNTSEAFLCIRLKAPVVSYVARNMVQAIRDVAGDSPVVITGDFNARMHLDVKRRQCWEIICRKSEIDLLWSWMVSAHSLRWERLGDVRFVVSWCEIDGTFAVIWVHG